MQDVPQERSDADARPSGGATSQVRFAGLVLDLDACTLVRESGEAIPLTPSEFKLLRLFVCRPGRVLGRDAILEAVANRRLEQFDRSVDALVGRLRRKIESDPKQPRLIVTVPGEGYRFDGLERCASSKPSKTLPGVNIAARLQGVAKPLFEQAHWQVTSPLDPKAADLDPTQLRDIAEPVHVHSLEVGQPAETKPASAAIATVKQESATPSPRASGWAWGRPALAVVATLVLFAAGGWALLGGRLTKPAQAAHLSIVILPFANLSGDPAQDYFADGVTENLTTELSRIKGSFVIARNTA
ncbi:MAG: winged helix-turn-helix domain-containing protein, partial [Hyphomicrobiales bacterium]|nr:winged helix-turn-helix domain-containing protein [Hyphomicrobiales bacterium]